MSTHFSNIKSNPVVAELIKRRSEEMTRQEQPELSLHDRRMTEAEERHQLRKMELKQQLTPENFEKWLHFYETGWFTAKELEEWVVVHQWYTDAEMGKWFKGIEERKLQTEEEREMAIHCVTIKQLAEGRERLELEKKLNRKEFSLWLPYRRLLSVQHLKNWLQLRPLLINALKMSWTRQRLLNGKSDRKSAVAWLIVEQRILAQRFSLWLSEKIGAVLPVICTVEEWLIHRPG